MQTDDTQCVKVPARVGCRVEYVPVTPEGERRREVGTGPDGKLYAVSRARVGSLRCGEPLVKYTEVSDAQD